MADTKFNARFELLYVTTSDPGDESARRLPSNYTQVGLVVSKNLSVDRNMIDANDKDVGQWTEVIPGRNAGALSLTCNRPRDANAGQDILTAALTSSSGTLLYFLLSTNTVGDNAVHGTAYVDNVELGSDDESVASFIASLVTQGTITFFNINT